MKLIYSSKALPITIENYIASSFEYDRWVISDYYNKVAIGYEYGFIVTTKEDVIDCNSLSALALYTSIFVEKLTLLIKYAVGVSLNAPHNQVVHRRTRAIDVRELPKGWNSNYKEVDDYLLNTLTGCHISVTPFPQNAVMPVSALDELKTALENYDGLDGTMKDLIAIHNSAVEADERACYLILGKVLEIINLLYPYKRKHGKDRRINDIFPELLPLFGEVTIKDLMGMANSRKETRHYGSSDNKVYEPLTAIDAETYYQRIDALALQIIRKALGLPSVMISTGKEEQ